MVTNAVIKLTRLQVDEIRRLRIEGMMNKDIAELYGVSRTTTSAICHYRIWKD
jgi:uncharacterized protein YjcR